MADLTKVFLNTWGAYNNGSIGYGWMEPAEAIEFMEENEERDGGEWFIADIDNYTNCKFDKLEYENAYEFCKMLERFNDLDEYDQAEAAARVEAFGEDLSEAMENLGNSTFWYNMTMEEVADQEADEFIASLTAGNKAAEALARYFDYEAFKRDLSFDYTETETGVISNY